MRTSLASEKAGTPHTYLPLNTNKINYHIWNLIIIHNRIHYSDSWQVDLITFWLCLDPPWTRAQMKSGGTFIILLNFSSQTETMWQDFFYPNKETHQFSGFWNNVFQYRIFTHTKIELVIVYSIVIPKFGLLTQLLSTAFDCFLSSGPYQPAWWGSISSLWKTTRKGKDCHLCRQSINSV